MPKVIEVMVETVLVQWRSMVLTSPVRKMAILEQFDRVGNYQAILRHFDVILFGRDLSDRRDVRVRRRCPGRVLNLTLARFWYSVYLWGKYILLST